MSDDWPTSPPSPTDTSYETVRDPDIHRCTRCREVLDEQFAEHDCPVSYDEVTTFPVNDQFAVVVPRQTGNVWTTKTNGSANGIASVHGELYPLGRLRSAGVMPRDEDPRVETRGMFDHFDDPEEARQTYLRGLRKSPEVEYGGVDLAEKRTEEQLATLFADGEEETERLRQTQEERLVEVWERIDEVLPFEYERVAAPKGCPLTKEGIRWIDVTGRNADRAIRPHGWVDELVEYDGPVALFYPNSD